MRLTCFTNERASIGAPADLPEAEVVRSLTTHTERVPKEGPAWSPAELAPCPTPCRNNGKPRTHDCGGGAVHRHNDNVVAHCLVVFDVDHASSEVAGQVLASLQSSGIRSLVHTTHSHAPPSDQCLRVVLFPDRAIAASEVRSVRCALQEALSIPVDPQTKDLSRLYYLPAHAPGAEHDSVVFPGEPFSVDSCLPSAQPSPQPQPQAAPATSTVDASALRASLKAARVTTPEGKDLVRRVLKGEPLAALGEHDASLHRLARLLATYLPEATPYDAVVALCETSLRRMDWQDGYEDCLRAFEEKWARAVEDVVAYRHERAAAIEGFRRDLRIAQSAQAEDPLAAQATSDGKYTAEALAAWAIAEREWVVQKGDTYWVFTGGRYVPRLRPELPTCLGRDLLRSPCALEIPGDRGPKALSQAEVLQLYGTVAERVESSLVLQRSRYDSKSGVFYEAVCPRRPLVPKEHPEIQAWLEMFGSSDKERFLDWVASVARLDRQCCALYLHGPGGTGKTLLPLGLARIWTTGAPADLGEAMGKWTDVLCTCPLVFADEKLPQSKTISEDLREMLGTTARKLTRRYMPTSSLIGAVRLIVSGNNRDLLRPQGDMTEFDLDAVSERFLSVEIPAQARTYLLDLGGPAVVNKWITEDRLAEHALWLAENRVVVGAEGSRFIVTGKKERFHERLAVNSGVGGGVCEVLVKQVSGRKPLPPALKDLFLVGSGDIYVNVNAIEALWPEHVKSMDVPSVQRLSKALAAISSSVEKRRVNCQQRNYARVRIEQLVAWAEESGVADGETLRKLIEAPCEAVEMIRSNSNPTRGVA